MGSNAVRTWLPGIGPPEILDRPRQSGVQPGRRLPAQLLAGFASIKEDAIDLAQFRRPVRALQRILGQLAQLIVYFVDARAAPRADVVNLAVAFLKRQDVGTRNVAHVHKITLLLAR